MSLQCVPSQLPMPKGGTIVDGTYVMTSAVYYGTNCPAAEQDRNKWLVCGSTWQTVQENDTNGTPMENWYNLNVTASGMTLQLQGVCGFTQSLTFQYDATPNTISLFVGGSTTPGEGRVDVYTRQ